MQNIKGEKWKIALEPFQSTDLSIWKKIGIKRMVIVISGIIILGIGWMLYLHIVNGYVWANWIGFGNYNGDILKDNRGKTLWDWLDLLVVPIVLAFVALLFNKSEHSNECFCQLKNRPF